MIISKYTQIIPFFFYAINAKIITEKEIVDWADNELRNETEPPYFIVALSLSHSVNEQFSILN